jgi:ATP synthase F1 delta subunit
MATYHPCIPNYLDALLANEDSESQVALIKAFNQLAHVVMDTQPIWVLLQSPLMSIFDRMSVISQCADRLKTPQKVINMFRCLVKNNRLMVLADMVTLSQKRSDRIQNIFHANVVSATPLSPEQIVDLTNRLISDAMPQVTISTAIDASLIAGLTVSIDNTVYDMSLRSVFADFKQTLKRSSYDN